METLEEAAQGKYPVNYNLPIFDQVGLNYAAHQGFIEGAKWQMERSYSEEEVKDIMAKTWIKCVGNDGNNFKKIRDEILKQIRS